MSGSDVEGSPVDNGVKDTCRQDTGHGDRGATPLAALMPRLQRIVLRTSAGPARHLWGGVYVMLTWAWARWLRAGDHRATAYATRGSGTRSVLHGISDIDLAVVVSADPGCPGRARARVLARQDRLRRTLPWLARTVLDQPVVLEEDELAEAAAASALLSGLTPGSPASVFYGPASSQDRIGLQENPGVGGPLAAWRRVGGAPRGLPRIAPEHSAVRIAAWLELQAWWRWFLQACGAPPAPDGPYLCLKLVAEPARIWLALSGDDMGEATRRDVLERALRTLPEEEAVIRSALALERSLTRSPDPPWAESVNGLVRFTERIAQALADDVEPAGTVPVAIDSSPSDELAVRADSVTAGGRDALLPLADWRALVRGGLRWGGRLWTAPPDETLAPVRVAGLTFDEVASRAREGDHGPYPALRSGQLLVLASRRWPRTQFRAVQCPLTDPVSFALLDRRGVASFPDVPGWSAADTAARAVAEHRAWLADPGGAADAGHALSMLISAARAALFARTVTAGSPALTPTVAATLRAMRAEWPNATTLLDEVQSCYFSWRRTQVPPADRVVSALRAMVAGIEPLSASG
jgi:hypothetical protein